MFSKLRLYISPFFLPRYYIQRDIINVLSKYKFTGKIIDLGCGTKPYEALFKDIKEYEGIDFKSYSINKDFQGGKPDYYFDKNYLETLNLPFKDDNFDHSVAFQVLEHHRNPAKMISEMSRVTKKGGYLLLTAPFLAGVHEEPNDYQRFTKYGLNELIRGFGNIVEYKEEGSVFSTISLLLNEHLNVFAAKNRIAYLVAAFIYLPFFIFQYLCIIFDKVLKSKRIYFNYLVLIKNEKK